MRLIYLLIPMLLFSVFAFAQQAQDGSFLAIEKAVRLLPPPPPPPHECFCMVEFFPVLKTEHCLSLPKEDQYNCCRDTLEKYIQDHIQYPTNADNCDKCIVYTRFYINLDGKMENFEIAKNTTGQEVFVEEALRVMNKLNAEMSWVPAEQRGQSVRIRMMVPIVFKRH